MIDRLLEAHPWLRVLGIAFGAVIGVACCFGGALVAFGGANTIDPTDRPYKVFIENDIGELVQAKECKLDCTKFVDSRRLDPGRIFWWDSSRRAGVAEWYLIEDGAGTVLGCLDTKLAPDAMERKVAVSQVGPCPISSASPAA